MGGEFALRMKIGIVTWFDFENYGTKLQAIALQYYLRSRGNTVELINFKVPGRLPFARRKKICLKLFSEKFSYWALKCAQIKYREQLNVRSHRLKNVIQEKCTVTEKVEDDDSYVKICNKFDLLVFGSDQIWNPSWYHPYYYADFPEIKSPKIAYAPSLGVRKIPDDLKEVIKKGLAKFALVTVREERAQQLLKPLLGYLPAKVLDPTLLLSGQQWKEMFQIKSKRTRPYQLCYFLSDNWNHWRAIKKIAEQNNLEVIILPQTGFSFFKEGIICADAGVKEFLELISNAEYVFTDSFHGTVFSLLFEREVYIFERFMPDKFFSQNDRVIDLAKQFELEDHLVKYNSYEIALQKRIPYQKVNSILEKMRTYSKNVIDCYV